MEAMALNDETEGEVFSFGASGDFNADSIPPPDTSRTRLTPSMYSRLYSINVIDNVFPVSDDQCLANLKRFRIKLVMRQTIAVHWFLTDLLQWPQFANAKWKLFNNGSIQEDNIHSRQFLQIESPTTIDIDLTGCHDGCRCFGNTAWVERNIFQRELAAFLKENVIVYDDVASYEQEEGQDFEWIPSPIQ